MPKILPAVLRAGVPALALAAAAVLAPGSARAVPSYARQTGFACEACHTVFPELTPFGRMFKATGYTMVNTKKVEDINTSKQHTLSISDLPPISMMAVVSTSQMAKANNSNSASGVTDFPQQLSLFYAGRITDNLGTYLQLTYSGAGNSIGMDNTDIRFADRADMSGNDVIYGISINNNPTVQDLYNTAPAWQQPYMSPATMNKPAAAMMIASQGQTVAGLTAYTFINRSIYGEAGVYRTAHIGTDNSLLTAGNTVNNVISTGAPYWRLAYERDWQSNSLEVGTFGMYTPLENPTGPVASVNNALRGGSTDNFLDTGLDAQYQYITDNHQFSLQAQYFHEAQNLNASYAAGDATNKNDYLDQVGLIGTYYYKRHYGASLSAYQITGKSDALRYTGTGGAPFVSNNGSPNSNWAVAELDYLPWLNTKIGLQYTMYGIFNGESSNYDGNGRNAPSNNMLYAYLWFAF